MLQKLMNMINLKWAKNFQIAKPLNIGQGTGTNPYLTVRDGILYFHAYLNAPDMLPNQEIVLDGLLMSDLVTQITSMGYTVDSSEGQRLNLLGESALLIMDTENQPLSSVGGVSLFAFTSNFHRVLYPIHRILTEHSGDVDKAIEQLMLPSTSGDWLDYWCSFFQIQRLPSEDDEGLLRRTLLTISSAKSNNTAMEELISYYIGTEALVMDSAASQIEVRVDPMYMDSAQKVRDIIATIKSAGVDYFINYQKKLTEDYDSSFFDKHGMTFDAMNGNSYTTQITFPIYTEDYQYIPPELQKTFYLNSGTLNTSTELLSHPKDRIVESLSMVMTDSNGNIVQQM
jgi:hypothetical protein